ncbi:ATP-binding cassette domain-containing protein [Psychrobacter sp. SMN/5/1215-MNA-CIBAN-0208]|uniref:ABC transporter ATP-binding protein n=1 Tax=Psychrobacter sp. SMN/5/1215-MNA-CIBAN-0208 TaxID=3140442 RepID=UPI0033325276
MTVNKKPLLTFENIWVYSKRSTMVSPSGEESAALASEPATPKKWLTTIKSKLKSASDNSLSTHKRALITGVSGTLQEGQVTVLTGHSGSGKSVLLRALAGLSPITIGDVWLRQDGSRYKDGSGQNSNEYLSIHDTSPTQWRAQVALLAQHPQLLEGSVLENMQMPYRLQAHQHRQFDIDWHIEQLAYLKRTADFLQQEASHLSGGERQLVNTLRLLQLNPQVLLLDEPTAALDADTSAKLVHLLISWLQSKPQRTLLWITHDTQDIMPLADKHWHMQAGVLTEIF